MPRDKNSPPAKGEYAEGGRGLVPKLRFPEFRDDWHTEELGQLANVINDRAGNKKYRLMSITSGIGLVSQIEKFGREIAGNAYKNYIVIHDGDFAYNKSATKEYPEGFIAKYTGTEPGAVPNSIFLCFRVSKDKISPEYLNYLFYANLHGKWLRKFIAVGARAHGSLNVDEAALLSLPVPLPKGAASLPEQQRIADCLTSLDAVISAENQKLDALKAHKKGLMQGLFPDHPAPAGHPSAGGEVLGSEFPSSGGVAEGRGGLEPRLRFPEFRDSGEWVSSCLGEIAKISSGGTPSRSNQTYWNGHIPWITTSLIDFNIITEAEEFITELGLQESAAKVFPENTIIMAMYGQGKTRGKVAKLGIKAATNQACAAILIRDIIDSAFLFQNLSGRYDEIRRISNAGGQENLSAALIETIAFKYPNANEQKKIADCLTSLDELIAAQAEKIAALKERKKGLMQGLFPNHPAPAGHPSAGGEGSAGI
jgi:type I restriction enzyme S subunit